MKLNMFYGLMFCVIQVTAQNQNTFICGESTITDYDGNKYNTVQIGKQCWIKENLKTIHYTDGTSIRFVNNDSAWKALTINEKAYCYYKNDNKNALIYGNLYTWSAAMNGAKSSNSNPSSVQGICPAGWHLPGDNEWKQLELYLGMTESEADKTGFRGTNEGGKLKENGTLHWKSPNKGATNEINWNGLPGGSYGIKNVFVNVNCSGYWWSSTKYKSSYAVSRHLDYSLSTIDRIYDLRTYGFSVRCIKD